jgi:(p)ppGpp synthase/HD superfamily hydrolase
MGAHLSLGHMRLGGEHYHYHVSRVADTVSKYGGDDAMIAAAYMHDLLEDTKVPPMMLANEFGDLVLQFIQELTNPKREGPRNLRQQAELARLSTISPEAKLIKLADILDNTSNPYTLGVDFAKVYYQEKAEQLSCLSYVNEPLWQACYVQIHRYLKQLEIVVE